MQPRGRDYGSTFEGFRRLAASDAAPVSRESILQIVRGTPVVAVGESAHGGEEALAFRNLVFRTLVESAGFKGIALETGYAEAIAIDDFVNGGQGIATEVALRSLTSGFGNAPGSSTSSNETGLGDVVRQAAPAPFLLDVRAAPDNLRTWLAEPRSLRANRESETIIGPAAALDVAVVQARHSPARPNVATSVQATPAR